MIAKVQRWGNSLGLRIPKALAHGAHVEEGKPVELKVINGRLIVSPLKARRYDLDELLAHVTKRNIHGEEDFGAPAGKEIW